MESYKTEGVVLKRSNFGEADRILTIFTRHQGKVVCLAKGIRKMTSKKAGGLEIFNRVKLFIVKGKGMGLITEVELLDSFSDLRKNLPKIAVAYQLCEMVDKLTAEDNEQKEVYDLLVSYLRNLKDISENNLSNFANFFASNLVKLLGFWPKDKAMPSSFNVTSFIEGIIERELKSKKFLKRI